MQKEGKFKLEINKITVRHQNEIIKRLTLFDFAESAIESYCEHKQTLSEGYDFTNFNSKFKLVEFKKDKPIQSIPSQEMVATGAAIIRNELIDAIFILNTSSFETWILDILKQKYMSDKNSLYPDLIKKKKDHEDYARVDMTLIKGVSTIDELWEKIIDHYLHNIPYDGINNSMNKLINVFKIPKNTQLTQVAGCINEIFLCRNVIVHNQKIIGEEYVHKAGKHARFTLNEKVIISDDMLIEQADNILKFMQDFKKTINSK